jgi:hypothetical protein
MGEDLASAGVDVGHPCGACVEDCLGGHVEAAATGEQ